MEYTQLVQNVRATGIAHAGFRNEAALIESLAESCRGRRTAMITGNYAIRGVPSLVLPGDPRLLGKDMLMTIELCVRIWRKCAECGIPGPTIIIMPNDLVPGTFRDSGEAHAFKSAYVLPDEITSILSSGGITQAPAYFFNRHSGESIRKIQSELRAMRARITEGVEKLVVALESSARNIAWAALKRNQITPSPHADMRGSHMIAPAEFSNNVKRIQYNMPTKVVLTQENGAPFCSFLAATLLRDLETLGFEQAINTFVWPEYPCVDKAATAYRHLYAGRMPVRNIYLAKPGSVGASPIEVFADNTIL